MHYLRHCEGPAVVQPPGLVLTEANLEERRGDSIEIIVVKKLSGKRYARLLQHSFKFATGGRKKFLFFVGGRMQEFIHHSCKM